jgi:hypothetical protein
LIAVEDRAALLGDRRDLADHPGVVDRLVGDDQQAIAEVGRGDGRNRLVVARPRRDHKQDCHGERAEREPERRAGGREADDDRHRERGHDQRQHPGADDQRHEPFHVR